MNQHRKSGENHGFWSGLGAREIILAVIAVAGGGGALSAHNEATSTRESSISEGARLRADIADLQDQLSEAKREIVRVEQRCRNTYRRRSRTSGAVGTGDELLGPVEPPHTNFVSRLFGFLFRSPTAEERRPTGIPDWQVKR